MNTPEVNVNLLFELTLPWCDDRLKANNRVAGLLCFLSLVKTILSVN